MAAVVAVVAPPRLSAGSTATPAAACPSARDGTAAAPVCVGWVGTAARGLVAGLVTKSAVDYRVLIGLDDPQT